MDRDERLREILRAKYRKNIPYLISTLNDDENRFAVIRYLVKMNATEAIPEIRRLLRTSDSHVRNEAVIALGKLGARDAIPDIERIAESDPEPWVKAWAIDTLRILGSESALHIALENIADEDSRVRASCAMVVGERGSEEDLPALMEGLSMERHRPLDASSRKHYA